MTIIYPKPRVGLMSTGALRDGNQGIYRRTLPQSPQAPEHVALGACLQLLGAETTVKSDCANVVKRGLLPEASPFKGRQEKRFTEE